MGIVSPAEYKGIYLRKDQCRVISFRFADPGGMRPRVAWGSDCLGQIIGSQPPDGWIRGWVYEHAGVKRPCALHENWEVGHGRKGKRYQCGIAWFGLERNRERLAFRDE